MPTPLTWEDLIIQKIDPVDAQRWLSYWSGWVEGQVAPLFLSQFGDWFLRRSDGATDELSVIEGTFTRVATDPLEFQQRVNSPPWQEEHLLSRHIRYLHDQGVKPAPGECYAFAPHPAWTGRIDLGQATTMSLGAWQLICAQTFGPQPAARTTGPK